MKSFSDKPEIAIVGLGNELMGDDGLGVHAIHLLQKEILGENIKAVEVGTASLHFQDLFEKSDIVIGIDAISAGRPAGQIYCFDGQDTDLENTYSLHDLGIGGVMHLIPKNLRPTVIIVGAEPLVIDYGTELSDVLQEALPKLVELVKDILNKLENTKGQLIFNDLFPIRM